MNDKFKRLLDEEAERLFKKALSGQPLTKDEAQLIVFVNKLNDEKGNKKTFDISSIAPLISTILGGIL